MLLELMRFQGSYYQSMESSVPPTSEFLDLHYLLHPEMGQTADPKTCKALYERFVPVNRAVSGVEVTDEMYRKNLKTLWMNAKRLQENLDEVLAVCSSSCMALKASTAQIKADWEKLKEANKSCNQDDLWRHSIYSWGLGVTLGQKEEQLERAQGEQQKLLNSAMIDDLRTQVKQAILDGSFLLIHDLITLMKATQFCPDHEAVPRLYNLRQSLCYRQLIQDSIGHPERVIQAAQEIENLDAYAYSVQQTFLTKHMLYEPAKPKKAAKQVEEFLAECLHKEIDQQALIVFISSLPLISEKRKEQIVMSVIRDDVLEDKLEHAKKLLQFNLVSEDSLQSFLASLLIEALKGTYLQRAQSILCLNANKSPVPLERLKSLFLELVRFNHAELLHFIQGLIGKIPQLLIDEAIEKAKNGKHDKALQYLQAYASVAR